MAPRQVLALALVLLAPTLAGCTLVNPPPVKPAIDPELALEAYVVPDLDLRVDHRYGSIRAQGSALAFPLRSGGQEYGAVYLGANVSWRTDAGFQVRQGDPAPGDLYVQPPRGEWAALRSRQAWAPAGEQDLLRFGSNATRALAERASAAVPPASNRTAVAATPGAWLLNGTLAARVFPDNITLATAGGTYVFQRDAAGFIAVEGRTIVSWKEANRSLAASHDALASAEILDPALSRLELTWSAAGVRVRLVTPPFRISDLEVEQDDVAKIATAKFPRVAEVTMVKYISSRVADNAVEFLSPNMTFIMAP